MSAAGTVLGKAGELAIKYGPAVADAALDIMEKSTNGKVRSTQDIAPYVGNNPSRAKVIVESMVKSGMRIDDVLPDDAMGDNSMLGEIKKDVRARFGQMQESYNRRSDRQLGANDIPADVIRMRRVKAVMSVYGNEENYFLCHPDGGVPAEDFAFFKAMRGEIR